MVNLQYIDRDVIFVSLRYRFQSNLLPCSDPEDEPGSPEAGKLKDWYQISSPN